MDAEFICREIDDRKGEGLAIGYELHTHPDLWLDIKDYLGKLSPIGRDLFVFP